jgi:ABC-2 type transport system ATP-binding protein
MSTDILVPAVRTEGLGRRFGRRWALRDCALTLPAGRVAALVGPNGAGKSTLLGVLSGLSAPSSGTVSVFGEPLRGQIHPRAAFVAQQRPLYESVTVRETLRMVARSNHRWSADRAQQVLDAGRVPRDVKVRSLSGGARTHLALALAFGREPDLLLLDEPLAGLDPLACEDVLALLMSEVAEREMTILMSSNHVTDLHEICDHLVLLDDGQVRLAGDVAELLADHRVLTGAAEPGLPSLQSLVVDHLRASRQAGRVAAQ